MEKEVKPLLEEMILNTKIRFSICIS